MENVGQWVQVLVGTIIVLIAEAWNWADQNPNIVWTLIGLYFFIRITSWLSNLQQSLSEIRRESVELRATVLRQAETLEQISGNTAYLQNIEQLLGEVTSQYFPTRTSYD